MSKAAGGKAPSLAGRFAAAIALTIGFYVLALAIALALIGIPVFAWIERGSFNIWLTIFGVITGVSILVAIVPRRLPFTPPGPPIDAAGQPRLMTAVEQVAADAGQSEPEETYATLEVNAAVTEVSNGFLRGRRRVLIVGLPLLHVVSERAFRGVLAHEFGHYAGGDTRLGPWIWRTRETIGRTIERLSDDEDDSWSQRAVRAPFIWYGKAFLRITSAISRRQEFAADALAANTVGRDAYVEGLRRVHALAPGFDAYWEEEVAPVLEAGQRPPLLAGFASFVGNERIEAAAKAQLDQVLAEESGAYDSHPSLAQRIAALAGHPAGAADDSPPAHALLDDEPALERAALAPLGEVDALAPVDWDEVGERVWVARYRELVAHFEPELDGMALGDAAASPGALATAIGHRHRELIGAPADMLARKLLMAQLTLAFVDAGWRVQALPGDPLTVVRDGERVAPGELLAALETGELTPAEWRERAAAFGRGGARYNQPRRLNSATSAPSTTRRKPSTR